MNSPLAGDRFRLAPSRVTKAHPRTSQGPRFGALAWARLRRGASRQLPLFLVATAFFVLLGVGYEISWNGDILRAALLWSGIGAAAALGAALIRELGRNSITSLQSLGKHRGYAVLGAAPELTPAALRQLPPDQRSPLGCLAHMPASPFATAFRDVQGVLSGDRIVSFAAATPREGASTVALCTAVSATQQGRRTVILDCDLRRRSLTRGFGLDPDVGVLEACEEPEYWREYIEEEAETGLHFIPAARPISAWRSLAGAPGWPVLLKRLQQDYDLVVLDCPPILTTADGPVLARMAAKCVMVTVWDHTPIPVLRQAVRALRGAHTLTGVYVNRVPPGYRFGRLRPD